MSGRLRHIDIARGIGILLIVFGHNWIVSHERGKLFNIIFSFHVPLFFFISGLFFIPKIKITNLIVAKFDSLLKPYFVSSVVWGIYYIINKRYSPAEYFLGVLYGSGHTIPWTPLWFLPHMWFIFVFLWCLSKMTHLESASLVIKSIILFTLLIVGYYLVDVFWKVPLNVGGRSIQMFGKPLVLFGLPYSIDLALLSSFYFLTGFFVSEKVLNFKFNSYILILNLITFGLLHSFFDYTIDFNLRTYDNLVISTIEAFSGIYIIISIAYIVSKLSKVGDIFAYIGTGSLFILIFHGYFQLKAFEILSAKMGGELFYAGVIAFIAGFVIPLLTWEIIKSSDYLALFWLPVKYNKLFKKLPVHHH